jgi:hypothetical protein
MFEIRESCKNKLIERMDEIKKQDADKCARCSGEDCMCCEIYHDRMAWISTEELFCDF